MSPSPTLRSVAHRVRRHAASPARAVPAALLLLALLPALPPGLPAPEAGLHAQVDARLLRQPDVSETHITFVYAGDIWTVPKEGGTAHRLASPPGEESFPRFSPDGSRIAFTGNYDGNTDVYVIPALGGVPTRVTHHPMPDRLIDWFPDGEALLYASSRESGRQRYSQFYRVSAEGGLPEKLPVPYGEFASLSPDGGRIAYTPKTRAFRTWKRYRGGWAPDIWLFDLRSHQAENVTDDPANDDQPMWHEGTVYFLSDRGPERRYNLWAYDLEAGALRQVTDFDLHDVHFPALGPGEIVFEAGGRLHLMELETEAVREVAVDAVTDRATLKPRTAPVADLIEGFDISPTGKRAVFEARGELFTVPAEHGPIRPLTRSSGVAERHPAWSPDGRWIAHFTDRGGEYELAIRPADGSGDEEVLTALGPGYRYRPHWSPDSRRLAFIDQAMRIRILDRETGEATEVDRGLWMYQGALQAFRPSWSPDGRWLAWSRGLQNRRSAVFLHDTESGETRRATSGFYSDALPVFGPEGKHLFLLTDRSLEPVYSDLQNTWVYPNATRIAAVPLRRDVPSPLAPRSDEETPDAATAPEEEGEKGEADEGEGEDAGAGAAAAGEAGATPPRRPAPPERVEIDLEGFERRLVVLPPEAGNYTDLHAAPGKVVYRRLPRTGSGGEESPVVYWDLEEREEKTVLADADRALLSHDGRKLLVADDGRFAVLDLRPEREIEDPMRTAEMEATVDPKAEWRQIFDDVWRFQRDFFYDPNLHGVDWEAMGERYRALLEDAVTRWDVNFVIGELIAELDASHTYRGGGDTEETPRRGVGLLGVDWEVAEGAYRIARIVDGAPWDSEVRSPLRRPGVDVSEGDWVLAVNGVPLDPAEDPWAAFGGTAGETVALTVNDRPTTEGAREVLVETLEDETRLRHLAWIDANRRRVEEATDGRVGYVYVPNTGVEGQTELVRQFVAQFDREGLVIDERFNSGGQIPDRFVELLDRDPLAFWAVRDGADWRWPPVAHFGPKVMLINGWSGSGGDAFPDYFRKRGVGPLIGTRTWGGLIGITGAPPLVDGGSVTVPTFRQYDPDGTWFAEGHGVDPDIEVPEDPTALAGGTDPQLEAAIREVLRLLEESPPAVPERPEYERRAPPAPAPEASRQEPEDGGGS